MKKYLKIIAPLVLLTSYVNKLYAGGDTLRMTESEAKSLIIQTMPDVVKNDSFSAEQNYLAYKKGSVIVEIKDSFNLANSATTIVFGNNVTRLISSGSNMPNRSTLDFEKTKIVNLWPFVVYMFLLTFIGTLYFYFQLKIREESGYTKYSKQLVKFAWFVIFSSLLLIFATTGFEAGTSTFFAFWELFIVAYCLFMVILQSAVIDDAKTERAIYLGVTATFSLLMFLFINLFFAVALSVGIVLGVFMATKYVRPKDKPVLDENPITVIP